MSSLPAEPVLLPPADPASAGGRVRFVAAAFALVAGVALIFGQSAAFEFVNYDDQEYVYENPIVRRGLTWAGFRWAWTTGHAANWHPLTWLSHMLDVELFGLWAGGHHLTSIALHAINSVLLLAFLSRMTRRFWPAAFVAAWFAWHPLRAESVAWVAERKDVLSTCFGLLSLLAYERYVRRDRAGRWFVASLLALAASLASKAMFVTMPCLMLLLDVWPLRRFDGPDAPARRARARSLALEKLPAFAVVAAIAIATFVSQSDGGAVMLRAEIDAPHRALNAIVSVMRYVGMQFAPVDLAPYYPHPYARGGGGVPIGLVLASALSLAALTAFAIGALRRGPFIAVGWLWFLGTLVPVIGLIQVGNQGLADRYTYVPGIGLGIVVAFSIDAIVRRHRFPRALVGTVAGIVLAAYGVAAHRQVSYWHDSIALMRRGAEAVPTSFVAHNNLGAALDAAGDRIAAERSYREALRLAPAHAGANINLASLLIKTGRADEATPLIEAALRADPGFAPAYIARGDQHLTRGEADAAFADYERAIRLRPSEKRAYHNYAFALAERSEFARAVRLWRAALAIDPDYENAIDGLGRTLLITGDTGEAYALLGRAIAMDAKNASARYVLAWSMATNADATRRDPRAAADLARQAIAIEPGNPLNYDAFAAALAAGGRFADAAKVADAAAAMLDAGTPLAGAIHARADGYRAGRPFVASPR